MIAEVLLVASLLHATPLARPIAGEGRILDAYQLTVTDAPRPFWKKLLRGTARVATFGMVQAATDSIKKDTPFHVESTHDGLDTDGYQLFLNTALAQQVTLAALVNGIVKFPLFANGLAKGTYQVVVRAVGPGGSTDSQPLALTVTAGNPSAPGPPKIIK